MSANADDLVEPAVIGTVIRNGGGEHLLIPEADLRRIDENAEPPTCQHCDGPLPPRQHTGGKPRRFCSDKCRSAFHAGCSPPSNPTVKSSSNAPPLPMDLPTVPPAKPPPKDNDTHAFDWCGANDQESIVLVEQRAVAIYRNKSDDLVIRQERGWCDDDDHYIVVSKENEHTLVRALCREIGLKVEP